MTDTKDDNQRTRIPYESPRLFDLGGGVAYAAVACIPGGSPAGKCKDGNAAPGICASGGVAGGNRDCKAGGIPTKDCNMGSTK